MNSSFIKKALLIESSSVRGCEDLPGARKDMQTWSSHLRSGVGGGWNDIQILSKPSLSLLKFYVNNISATSHYSFVVFSRHGYYDARRCATRIALNDTEQDVLVSEFVPFNNRSVCVVDACRGAESELVGLSAQNESVHNKQGMSARRTDLVNSALSALNASILQRYRMCFDAEAAKLNGKALLYSCGIGEAAGENKNAGGYYTSAITRAAKIWHDSVNAGKCSVSEAHDKAIVLLKARNIQQNPEGIFETQGRLLPFGVKPR